VVIVNYGDVKGEPRTKRNIFGMQNDIKIHNSGVPTIRPEKSKLGSKKQQLISVECPEGRLSKFEMEDEAGFFNINLGSDESADDAAKVPRDFQSEEDFQRQRREWRPKSEVGDVSLR
jgi:hypothetical protein